MAAVAASAALAGHLQGRDAEAAAGRGALGAVVAVVADAADAGTGREVGHGAAADERDVDIRAGRPGGAARAGPPG